MVECQHSLLVCLGPRIRDHDFWQPPCGCNKGVYQGLQRQKELRRLTNVTSPVVVDSFCLQIRVVGLKLSRSMVLH